VENSQDYVEKGQYLVEKRVDNAPVMLVCNPIAGSRRGTAYLSQVRRALDAEGIAYSSEMSQHQGHAVHLARAAVETGCRAVVAIGGDGTFHEVVNGVMQAADANTNAERRVAVGLVQAGRGSDFGRSAGLPADIDSAISRLLVGRTQDIDLGHVKYLGFDGEEQSRYFANSAGLGFDAEVTQRANSAPRALGGTIPYLSSLLMTLGTFRNKRVTFKSGDGPVWHGRINSMVVANGQYFGGGMKIAPDAEIADGQFDVIILGDLGKVDLVVNVPRVYDGSHLTHPKVRSFRSSYLEASSQDRLLLQADGEVLGMAPASFSVKPAALRLIV